MPLGPGNYTSIIRGVNNTTGIAVSEAYKLSNWPDDWSGRSSQVPEKRTSGVAKSVLGGASKPAIFFPWKNR
jgi:hypothetical protein